MAHLINIYSSYKWTEVTNINMAHLSNDFYPSLFLGGGGGGDHDLNTIMTTTDVLSNNILDTKLMKIIDRIVAVTRCTMILKVKGAEQLSLILNMQYYIVVGRRVKYHHTSPRDNQPLRTNFMWTDPWKTCRATEMTTDMRLKILMTLLLFILIHAVLDEEKENETTKIHRNLITNWHSNLEQYID